MQKLDLTQVKIKLASKNDLSAIINMLADDELGKTREINIINQIIPESYLNAFNQIKSDANHMLIVMEYDSEIVGTLQLIIIPTMTLKGCIRAEVEGVRIKSSYQNLGLGKLMFDWVKTAALEKGCGLIQLTTNKSRVSAQNFYKKIGFVESHYGMKMKLDE